MQSSLIGKSYSIQINKTVSKESVIVIRHFNSENRNDIFFSRFLVPIHISNCGRMNATRQDVLLLMDKRKEMEEELSAHLSVLATQNVGMEDALVDQEGYPRNDIDVYKVRQARNRIICIRNDLKVT